MSKSKNESDKSDAVFVSRFPFQIQPSFHADAERLNVTASEFNIIAKVFEANELQGQSVDKEGYLYCCVISILGMGLFYTFPKSFKGVILLGLRRIASPGNIESSIDEDVIQQLLSEAKEVGFASNTSSLFALLRSKLVK
ncbi:MAG: hypothetical protein EXR27_13510 [Betaproteobacteria bacterium]|nr:hypothetical protein [Betaproteobacteria bacterium]